MPFLRNVDGTHGTMRVGLVLVFMVSGIFALVLGLRALITHRERSVIVWAACAAGLCIATLAAAELAGLME